MKSNLIAKISIFTLLLSTFFFVGCRALELAMAPVPNYKYTIKNQGSIDGLYLKADSGLEFYLNDDSTTLYTLDYTPFIKASEITWIDNRGSKCNRYAEGKCMVFAFEEEAKQKYLKVQENHEGEKIFVVINGELIGYSWMLGSGGSWCLDFVMDPDDVDTYFEQVEQVTNDELREGRGY